LHKRTKHRGDRQGLSYNRELISAASEQDLYGRLKTTIFDKNCGGGAPDQCGRLDRANTQGEDLREARELKRIPVRGKSG